MAQKKDNLPVKVDVDLQNGGTITYANEVIATIAGVAANEVDGIAGMCVSGGFSEILGRNRNITKGVKVEVGSQEAAVDLYIVVEYGKPIQKVAGEVQENVRKALESLTGLHVVRVDVHVQGVSFEKEKKAAMNSIEAANNPVLAAPQQPEPAPVAPAPEEKKAEEAPAPEAEKAEEAPIPEEKAAEEAPAPETETPAEAPAETPAGEESEPAPETAAEAEKPVEKAPAAEEKKPEPPQKKRPLGRKRC